MAPSVLRLLLSHERDDDLPPPPVGSESTDDEDDEEALGNESSDQVMAMQSDATSQVNHLCLGVRAGTDMGGAAFRFGREFLLVGHIPTW